MYYITNSQGEYFYRFTWLDSQPVFTTDRQKAYRTDSKSHAEDFVKEFSIFTTCKVHHEKA